MAFRLDASNQYGMYKTQTISDCTVAVDMHDNNEQCNFRHVDPGPPVAESLLGCVNYPNPVYFAWQ